LREVVVLEVGKEVLEARAVSFIIRAFQFLVQSL